jgi:hypothetical protein
MGPVYKSVVLALMSSVASDTVLTLCFAAVAAGCGSPQTFVVLDNNYPPHTPIPLVVYQAYWQAVSFPQPVAPDASSDAQSTVPASANTAYVLLAPGWDPTSTAPPTSFIVLQSQDGFGVHLGDTLHIPVDDAMFLGNCGARSFLTQAQADFITQLVFPSAFASFRYDAATCTTTPIGDAGEP